MPPKATQRAPRLSPEKVLAARARLNAAANLAQSTPANVTSSSNAASSTDPAEDLLHGSQENTQRTDLSDSQLESQETSFSQVPDSQLLVNQKKSTCRWSDKDYTTLNQTLVKEKAIHPSTVNGFKQTSWQQVVKALEGSEINKDSKAKDVAACKSRCFKTLWTMSGAGWDESSKMISLPPAVWKYLSLNTSTNGRDLSRWQNRPFPLFHNLVGLIEGNVATGDLMMTTADDKPIASGDIGNDVPPDSQLGDEYNKETAEITPAEVTPTSALATPSSSKRKRGSALSPEVILTEMRSMSSSLAELLQAPITPLVFAPSAPPPSVHMQAISLVQKESGLETHQIFEAIDFLGKDHNSEVFVSLKEELCPTWLCMKLGW
ncbi:hypothetical protein PCANC_22082 [Puccinia coronata f. sp. avenae]|uniref:Myb/SANT-like domain-containing protein n=1 Tax=Puccinia coronata f. sp. avenae TaxID=200324 RepID=A0A2N5SEY9_9BASI|nr:hypothetical protein PCANC_22082 [Puccinia coronata f. sp. avenae]